MPTDDPTTEVDDTPSLDDSDLAALACVDADHTLRALLQDPTDPTVLQQTMTDLRTETASADDTQVAVGISQVNVDLALLNLAVYGGINTDSDLHTIGADIRKLATTCHQAGYTGFTNR